MNAYIIHLRCFSELCWKEVAIVGKGCAVTLTFLGQRLRSTQTMCEFLIWTLYSLS